MNFYKLIAKGYDGLYEEEQKIKLGVIKSNLSINKNDLLLDVGCGTGLSSDFSCRIFGLDASIELIKQNKNNKNIVAKTENIPLKNNVFDKVVSVASLHNFDDIEKALRKSKE